MGKRRRKELPELPIGIKLNEQMSLTGEYSRDWLNERIQKRFTVECKNQLGEKQPVEIGFKNQTQIKNKSNSLHRKGVAIIRKDNKAFACELSINLENLNGYIILREFSS